MPTLKVMTQAGGKLGDNLVRKFSEYAKLHTINFFVMYGQTEATARISYLSPEDINNKPGSIGKAIPNGKLWIENKDGELIDQIDSVGELDCHWNAHNRCRGRTDALSEIFISLR